MARIAGVNIPTNKRVEIALQYIHGIGPQRAKEILQSVGIEEARRVNQLTDSEVLQFARPSTASTSWRGISVARSP